MASKSESISNKSSKNASARVVTNRSDFRPKNDFYNIANLTRFGPATIPGYTMAPNKVTVCRTDMPTPGPGAYYPENVAALGTRSPAFSLGARLKPPQNVRANLPAPNQYQEDFCNSTGCLNTNKAKTFGIRWNERKDNVTSNVPFYSLTNLNNVRTRYPAYKMAPSVGRVGPNYVRAPPSPGPSDYFPEPARDTRAFSFGTKYSNAVSTMKTNCEYQLI